MISFVHGFHKNNFRNFFAVNKKPNMVTLSQENFPNFLAVNKKTNMVTLPSQQEEAREE